MSTMNVKAFELVPVIESSQLVEGFREKTSANDVTCMDCCGRHCFLGSTYGQIVHYILEEKRNNDRIVYVSHLQGRKLIVQKKPLLSISFVAAVDKIVVLIDSIIYVLNPNSLEFSPSHERLKSVHSFCVNEQTDRNNPFGRQICIASKKRHFQLYNLTADKWIHIRDLALPELPMQVCMDGQIVCTTLQTKYMLMNTETAKLLDLFPYDTEQDSPFLKVVGKGEFLLGGPSNLGMFVTSSGMSPRPPMQLKEDVISVGFSTPYVVSLNNQFLIIHNILDQQQKQALSFQRGVCLRELNDRILVASSRDVYALVPVPWQTQVKNLLLDQRVEEALSLAEISSRASGMPHSEFKKLNSRFLQEAGFIEFSRFEFDKARQYFTDGGVDPQEIISLFPDLLPDDTDFSRSNPPLHEFADVVQITKGNLNKLEDCKVFLSKFLASCRYPYTHKKAVHTALVKIYAENSLDQLQSLISGGCFAAYKDCVQVLQIYGRFHCLAVFYQKRNELDKALTIWSQLLSGDLVDESFNEHGLPYFVKMLSELKKTELLFRYAPIVLDRDQELGAKIFTDQEENDDSNIKPQAVIDFLERFPRALIIYLEHIICQETSEQIEAYHSRLAMIYLDEILMLHKTLPDKDPSIASFRRKLQRFLRESSNYSVNLILGRVERDEWLLPEAAILYGKTEQHEKALNVLVGQLSDYKAAEEYCVTYSKGRSTSYKQDLFEALLRLYLEKSKNDERLRLSALDLLNSSNSSFNAATVAELVPEDWSIAILSKFLLNSVRSSLHGGRQLSIARQLAYRDYYLAKKDQLELEARTITLTDNSRCDVCHQLMKESNFVKQVNGSIAHLKCGKLQ